MSHIADSTDRPGIVSLPAWVDEVADRFDAAWRQGPRPRIAAFLGAEHGVRRTALLGELVKIDLEYRWKAGERPDLDGYRAEFPDLAGPGGALPDDLVRYAGKLGREFGGAPVPAADVCCPHCRNAIPLTGDGPQDVTCPGCGASFRVDPALPALVPAVELPRMLGRFQLLELLGSGSFGTVYKARDAELGRLVAVKVPRAGRFATPEEEGRFLREARSAGRLSHPGIVPVHEITYQDGVPSIVSDYVEGRTLAALLAERRPGFREAAELAAGVADALDHAHRNKVVHRDVSPRNILIDAAGRPHVTDFGLARRDEGSAVVTRDGHVLGTPAYMSPEQAAGEPARVDARSDVYGLGVVLYELLTGERPFRGTVPTLLRQVVEEEPRPPRKLNDRIPRDLETVCLKALAKAPARRYATAGDLADDLRRWLKGEPIRARPVGNFERTWRWCRRNPRVAGLTAAVGLLLLAVTGLSITAAVRSEQARRELAEAQARTERQRQETDAARRQAESVANYLIALVRRPDPTLDGHKVPDAEVLSQTVKQLRADPNIDVPTRVRLLEAVADTYTGLGWQEKPVPLLEEALALRRDQLGAEHPDTLSLMNKLGVAYQRAGRPADAVPLLEETLKLRRTQLGPEHRHTLNSIHNLALAYTLTGRAAEAIKLHEEALVLCKARLGPDHPDTLIFLDNLALAYHNAGRHADALAVQEEVLRHRQARLGPDHPDTVGAMNSLGMAYLAAGRLADSRPLLETALKHCKARLGPEHPHTLDLMNNLGGCLLQMKQFGAAAELLRDCFAIRLRKAPDDWYTFRTQLMLGLALAGRKQYAEAEEELRGAYDGLLARREQMPVPRRSHIPETARALVELYDAWGKKEQAEQWRRKLRAEEQPQPAHPRD
jgi:tetratricopeptide (TPR) repeat protein